MKKLTIIDAQQKLNERYPNEKLVLLEYAGSSKPSMVQCQTCKTKYAFKLAYNMFPKTKPALCNVCRPYKSDLMKTKIEKFKIFLKDSTQWEAAENLENKHSNDLIECKCKKCGNINKKTISDYMRGRGCPICQNNQLKSTEQFKQELPEGYELLNDYKGAYNKILIQHKCGFIYNVTPHNLLTGKGCPKCNRKQSKGEQKIMRYLTEHSINYIKEYQVNINNHNLRFDFYLPDLDIYIEYQGIQHYQPVNHFGGINRFKTQIEYDAYKQEYAKDKMLIISYQDFDNIEKILLQKFND